LVTAGLSPELLEGLNNVRLLAPEKLQLSCNISLGDPTADVRWYCNRYCCKVFREINNDAKYDITRLGDKMSLTVAASEVSDSATYRCEAVNKFGKVRTECLVIVSRTFRTCHCYIRIKVYINKVYNMNTFLSAHD